MRVAIVDDHPLISDAVATVIVGVTGHPSSHGFPRLEEYEQAVANGSRFDLVLLDLGLPGFEGLQALRRFRSNELAPPVVVLSAMTGRAIILEALDLGAMGFIPKTSRREVIMGALELVTGGGFYIPPEALVPESSAQSAHSHQAVASPRLQSGGAPNLTRRQRDVLDLLLKGMPNKVICRELGLSSNTVKTHISGLFRSLDANNRTQAVLAAHRLGLRIQY